MKKIIFICCAILVVACTENTIPLQPVDETVVVIKDSLKRRGGDGLYDVLGCGFNVTGDYANFNASGFQVIDIARLKIAEPTRVIEDYPFAESYKENYGENAKTYSETLTKTVFADATFGLFGGSIDFGTVANNTYDYKYIYGSYDYTIQQKRLSFSGTTALLQQYLTPTFIEDLNTSTPAELVADYGTHVMTDIYTGAKLDVLFRAETTNTNRTNAAKSLVKSNFLTIFNIAVTNNGTAADDAKNFNKKLFYKTRGGNQTIALSGSVDVNSNTPALTFASWKTSSTRTNSVLVDFAPSGLKLIYEFITNSTKKAAVKAYVDQYLIDNQVKITVPPPTPINVTTLYKHENYGYYGGYGISLPVGDYTLSQLIDKGIQNNDITSIRVAPGYQVILYDGADFNGDSRTVNIDCFDLRRTNLVYFNDRTSSIKIRVKP